MCPSYPALLVVPAAVDDQLLRSCSRFRSKGRVPALTWLHPNGAALCRSSQASGRVTATRLDSHATRPPSNAAWPPRNCRVAALELPRWNGIVNAS